ncbi:MAG TPA: peptidoglycan-binding protein, partial [Desulfurivibrionaceae bacterium]|nr:peptidoglycan-binding protein [Desulfurivibrionaceae bacterium]
MLIFARVTVLGLLLPLLHALPLQANPPRGHAAVTRLSWHLASGALNDKGQALFDVLTRADEQGLKPTDYLAGADPRGVTGEALTRVALAYIHDLKVGRKSPAKLDPALHISPPEIDVANLLSSVYASGDVKGGLERLAPTYPEYQLLKNKLAEYRQNEARGGWPEVPAGKTLELGVQDPAVEILRRRLELQGYLKGSQEPSPAFDALLADAVRNFQEHHGLDVDGKVGRRTREALNISIGDRIRQIILNMERWRWLPDDLGRWHMRVNIAGFYLR